MKILLTLCLTAWTVTALAQSKTTNTATQKTSAATGKSSTTATVVKPAINTVTNTSTIATTTKATAPAVKTRVEWADLDLTTANPPLRVVIKAPKGSTVAYDNGIVIWSPDSAYGVVVDMSYGDPPASIAERKKEAVENIIFKLDRWIVDKPDMLVYTVKDKGKTVYHFEVAVEAGGERYYLHDKWVEGRSFTQKQTEVMAEAARTLRSK